MSAIEPLILTIDNAHRTRVPVTGMVPKADGTMKEVRAETDGFLVEANNDDRSQCYTFRFTPDAEEMAAYEAAFQSGRAMRITIDFPDEDAK